MIHAYMSRRGAGKSRKMHETIRLALPARYVLVDPLKEHAGPTKKHRGIPGKIFFTYRELAPVLAKNTPKMRAIYQPSEDPQNLHFDDLCEMIYALGRYTLIIEELDQFSELHDVPKHLNHIIQQGRHQGIVVHWASRRPADISKKITSQCEVAWIGAMHEPRDIEYMKKAYGAGAERAASLQNFDWIEWRAGQIVDPPARTPEEVASGVDP